MKAKEYVKKYSDNLDIMEFTSDLSDDFAAYLELHKGRMTVTRFHNGIKQIFEKLKSISLRMQMPEDRYKAISKYFFATVILPSYRLFWKEDYLYRRACDEEIHHDSNSKKATLNRMREDRTWDAGRQRSTNLKNVFGDNRRRVNNLELSIEERIDRINYRLSYMFDREDERYIHSFFSWFKHICKPPFDIDDDLVIDDRPKQHTKESEHVNSYPTKITEALNFLGLLDDSISEITGEVIKHSYRMLAKIHHPDVGGDAENFRKLTEYVESLQKYFCTI